MYLGRSSLDICVKRRAGDVRPDDCDWRLCLVGTAEHRGEALVEGHHLADTAASAGGKVAEVAGRERRVLIVEPSGEQNVFLLQRPYFHTVPPDQIHRPVKGVIAPHA